MEGSKMLTDLLENIPNEIKDLKQVQKEEIAALSPRQGKIKEAFTKLPSRMGEAEQRISTLEVEDEMSQLTNKIEDLENHSRRSNIHLVGIPEGE
ncbi:hypothetical protein NDU88_003001 [Pleurodeles waltl]|uniref:Uncharacterized protein n=1 Tax=Pleurodeles waltl TaxID=8319 RepID=A0AAV7KTN4_PLEWA|nr:hypothetical protein NDU88_003001 [Pleurodeles waltl]